MKHLDEMPPDQMAAFDCWFDSLSKEEQAEKRSKGIIPYREMSTSRNPYRIIPTHPAYKYVEPPFDEIGKEDGEKFYSRSHILAIIRAMLSALADVKEDSTKANVAIIQQAFGIRTDKTQREIGKVLGISHAAVQSRIMFVRLRLQREIAQAAVPSDAKNKL